MSSRTINYKRSISEQEHTGSPAGKRQALSSGAVTFYLLWPERFVGHLIGKAGTGIAALRRDTRSQILIEDAPKGCEEQVVTISTAAQHSTAAILEVASKLSEIVTKHQDLSLRLLVTRPEQTGAIIGRGGSTIERLRRDFRDADFTLRPLDSSSSSHQSAPLVDPSKTVEILQISGGNHEEVLDALKPVADILASTVSSGDNSHSPHRVRAAEPGRGGSSSGRRADDRRDNSPSVMFRMLVPRGQIGQVIGVRGTVIQTIREETGAEVSLEEEASQDAEFRTVRIKSTESRAWAAQEALLEVVRCLVDDSQFAPVASSCWLVVPTPAVGAVIGSAGGQIRAFRKETNASITIVNTKTINSTKMEALRLAGDSTNSLVVIEGGLSEVENAFYRVSTVLLPSTAVLVGAEGRRSDGGHLSASRQRNHQRRSSSDDSRGRERYHSDDDYGRSRDPPSQGRRVRAVSRYEFAGHTTSSPGSSRSNPRSSQGPARDSSDRQELLLKVSNEQAGCIIGKSGANIATIRQISKASIAVRESTQGMRDVILEGNYHQIQAGKSMVEAFLAKDGLSLDDCHDAADNRRRR